ncbi:MAG: glycosyltransferase family 4 protein [Betaproteobacteria bacterium]|nr:glycosyltransferase family 4 protein [Betaproteobacteria bacterium]
MDRPIRSLLFSTLYPSSARPIHGIFVETRLRELLQTGGIETRVVAPVPWFPSTNPRWGEWARMASTPVQEVHNGIEVHHPRYPLPPKLGMTMAPLLIALAAAPVLRRLRRSGFDFDVIDAHYYYPDGVAAALLAKWFDRPVTITARGTDLNLIPQYTLPRRMIQWAAGQAHASIGVSSALVDVLRGLGLPEERLHVMRNGVDLQRFRPVPQREARAMLGIAGSGPLLLSVGHLVELKGHHLVIEALTRLLPHHPEARLAIVGAGEERDRLMELARARNLSERVIFAGQQPNDRLQTWYSAADALVLASSREGWANVLLEAMACGTPVVATETGGTPEVVSPQVGVLVSRDAASLAAGVARLLANTPKRAEVRAYAETFSWRATSEAQLRLFGRIAHQRSGLCHA